MGKKIYNIAFASNFNFDTKFPIAQWQEVRSKCNWISTICRCKQYNASTDNKRLREELLDPDIS